MQEVSDALEVESLDLEGQGVARRPDGKVVFVEGALPGERVRVQVLRRKNNWEQGTLETLLRESAQRVRPQCPHFGLHAGACGGCKMQHLHPAAQVAVKQRVLEDDLWHLAKVRPARVLRPIEGPAWGYRWRARLSVRHVAKKGTVLVGFHERKSRYVADMKTCPVLPPAISGLLVPLRELVGSLDQRDRIPQIELAVGDAVLALVLRHLEPLSAADQTRLRAFATEHAGIGLQWWLQPKGPETVHLLDEGGAQLGYALPEFDVFMPYRPTDFTQVNPGINRVLVARAVALLDPQPGERTIDWFCGLGNFSLPLARRGSTVLGVEGSATLVARARENAQLNALAERATFEARDLFKLSPADLEAAGSAQRWLVDPPREGAFALVKALAELRRDGPRSGSVPGEEAGGWQPPRRIVYVSCNPATLARDAGLLVHQAGYRCSAAGAVNMFPHTAHVESVAVFDLDPEAVFGAELGADSGAESGAEP
jgi:23S rRNA (uracil1939-C5)-methyltransferase